MALGGKESLLHDQSNSWSYNELATGPGWVTKPLYVLVSLPTVGTKGKNVSMLSHPLASQLGTHTAGLPAPLHPGLCLGKSAQVPGKPGWSLRIESR